MRMRMKPSSRTAPGVRASCEAFRFAEILEHLRSGWQLITSRHLERLVLTYRISPRPALQQARSKRTGPIAVIKTDLADVYRDYIACLNKQDWPKLEQFVQDEVSYNGQRIGLSGYREMLERDFDEIPDLYFNIHLLISDPPYIASRLGFDCAPKGKFLGLPVNGKRVSFTENVFYEFRSEKIDQVWSVIDKTAIESQL
jgi:predicted ester cyclase